MKMMTHHPRCLSSRRHRHIFGDFPDHWLQGLLDVSHDAYVPDIATPVHHDQDRWHLGKPSAQIPLNMQKQVSQCIPSESRLLRPETIMEAADKTDIWQFSGQRVRRSLQPCTMMLHVALDTADRGRQFAVEGAG